MTEPTDAPTAAELQREARRRADARRASGELPVDIDDQLHDDMVRALRRAADRGRVDTEAELLRATTFPTPAPGGPRRALVRGIKERVGRLGERAHLTDALTAIDAEQRRQARVVDDTAAQLDALAARITALERWAAVPGIGALPGPTLRTTLSDPHSVESLAEIALIEVLDDGADPESLLAAARRSLRRGGRLVVRTDRPDTIAAALEGWLEVAVEALAAPPPLEGADAELVDRLNELLGLDGRCRVVAVR